MAAPKPNTRHEIMEAALKEFAESGYDRTTMDAIAIRAQVAKGSLYYHFPSKEALFRALFQERAERLATLTEASVSANQWKGAMQAWSDFFWREKAFLELFLSEAWRNQERELLVRQFLQRIIEPLVPVFERGSHDSEMMAYALFGAIAVPALHLLKQPQPERHRLDDLVARLADWISAQTR
ncbi:TetR/AcrR family transcriptional regulator [Sulfobacillus harzensis]|uniref:TetR/AcrR family transcriptional regulator n=1 Tax=Sulfobacillus harzensis TaxID=2729629 RepID=A0A7Y0L4D7_9FIRM|nr:TetR/AcrR family transcriptional regulator [Sulfobacillus harzensis]NMP22732.1 TetR/AcrR family transcriptional regulator [Sulfobacillus harzensis]